MSLPVFRLICRGAYNRMTERACGADISHSVHRLSVPKAADAVGFKGKRWLLRFHMLTLWRVCSVRHCDLPAIGSSDTNRDSKRD